MQSLGGLLFPLLILLVFVPIFLSGRKQRRQMTEMQALQSSLEVGDVVTTTSGLRGTVVDASYEETVDLEIAEDVVTTWLRAAVRDKVADTAADTAAVDTAAADDPALDGATTIGATTAESDRDLASESASPAPSVPPLSGARVDPVDRPSDANGTPRP
jgi:preprotein translocase subunit YajC